MRLLKSCKSNVPLKCYFMPNNVSITLYVLIQFIIIYEDIYIKKIHTSQVSFLQMRKLRGRTTYPSSLSLFKVELGITAGNLAPGFGPWAIVSTPLNAEEFLESFRILDLALPPAKWFAQTPSYSLTGLLGPNSANTCLCHKHSVSNFHAPWSNEGYRNVKNVCLSSRYSHSSSNK